MWDHDVGWAGWLVMTLGMAGFWVLVALLAVALVRNGDAGREYVDPRQILERRLACGEIDVAEYQERLEAMSQPRR